MIDLIMWVGEEHYTVSSFIEEATKIGVSKRIPKNSIPEGIVLNRSRLFIKHRRAIVQGDAERARDEYSMDDLIDTLSTTRAMSYYQLPQDMLGLIISLESIEENEPEFWKKLVKDYGLTWSPGVIGYAYITGIQYIAGENETGLPEELIHLEGYVEPIRITYGTDDSSR